MSRAMLSETGETGNGIRNKCACDASGEESGEEFWDNRNEKRRPLFRTKRDEGPFRRMRPTAGLRGRTDAHDRPLPVFT